MKQFILKQERNKLMFDLNQDGKEDGMDYLIQEELLKEEDKEEGEDESNGID